MATSKGNAGCSAPHCTRMCGQIADERNDLKQALREIAMTTSDPGSMLRAAEAANLDIHELAQARLAP